MKRVKLTPTLVADFNCPVGKDQAFLWDSAVSGLDVRATKGGSRAYVFQGRHQGRCVRMTIGYADVCSIPEAQEVARELQRVSEQKFLAP